MGNHAISCRAQGECIATRHNHLRDALFHTAVSASLAPLREEKALLPGLNQRPADILLPNFSGESTVPLMYVLSPVSNLCWLKEPLLRRVMLYSTDMTKSGPNMDQHVNQKALFSSLSLLKCLVASMKHLSRWLSGLAKPLLGLQGRRRVRWSNTSLGDSPSFFKEEIAN